MKDGEGVSYQLFETYYARAAEAQDAGRAREAKQLYLLASESLLKASRQVTGETKTALIRRADKLQQLSDSIVYVPETASLVAGKTERVKEQKTANPSSDESTTVWVSAGKPNVRFEDIAGLEQVKDSIRRRVILPRLHPEVYETFQRKVSGGILLYGPPGTGKTMIAKAIACEVDAEFFSVRCSDIVGKYFGEAEKNVKSLFEAARSVQSAVLFFDEFEALAAHRGGNSTVMNRLVPELLSQMDGFSVSDSNSLLFLAATNRPYDIDSAFLRPPRLTEKVYVGLPDYEARLYLSRKALNGVPCDADVRPEYIAELTDGYNAADIVAFCEAMKDEPIDRSIDSGRTSPITLLDIQDAARRVHSSVQRKDIDRIRSWEQSLN